MPPSSPSRLMRVASGVSSTVAVSVVPIAFTTSWTKFAISVVSDIALEPRQSGSILAGRRRPPLADVFHAPFGRRARRGGRWRTNQPVREVLLADLQQVA